MGQTISNPAGSNPAGSNPAGFPTGSTGDELKWAEQVAQRDPGAAADHMLRMRQLPDFLPWGAYNAVKWLVQAQRREEALAESARLAEAAPVFIAGLVQRLDLLRGTPDHLPAIALLTRGLLAAERLDRGAWLAAPVLEAALLGSAEEMAAIRAKAEAAGLVDPSWRGNLDRLHGFLARLRDALPATPAPAFALGFAPEGGPCRLEGEVLHVNLSGLHLGPLPEVAMPLGTGFARALLGLLGPAEFQDDGGRPSLPHVTEDDAYTAILWRVLVFQAAEAPRRARQVARPPEEGFDRPGLWVRSGNVELWALWNHLHDGHAAWLAAQQVAAELDALDPGAEPPAVAAQPWWPRLSAVWNIRRLATNAGWYARPGRGGAAFRDWARRYLAALEEGGLLSTFDPDYPRLAALAPGLRGKTFTRWTDHGFMRRLGGARVVLVSAFADAVRAHHASGGLAALWQDMGFRQELAGLETVRAPVSVWPYYPARDWSESFAQLAEETAAAISRSGADLLVASCGAYGLPLVHEMHRRSGIACVYFGHLANLYFGVHTEAFRTHGFRLRTAASPHWIEPGLERDFPAIRRIDKGRYAASPKAG